MKYFTHFRRIFVGAVPLVASVSGASADVMNQFMPGVSRVLYEDGLYLEFGAVNQEWEQSSEARPSSITNDYWSHSGAVKLDLTDQLSFAFILDQPINSEAKIEEVLDSIFGLVFVRDPEEFVEIKTQQASAILAYDVTPNFKLYGGVRSQEVEFESTLGLGRVYPAEGFQFPLTFPPPPFTDREHGYVVGAAFDWPEHDLRLALTRYSEISYNIDVRGFFSDLSPAPDGKLRYSTPEWVQLDFQVGVTPTTQLFGFVKRTYGADTAFAFDVFGAVPPGHDPIAGLTGDFWTYNLGVAQQFTDRFAGAFSVTYEPKSDAHLVDVLPYNGLMKGTAALSYDFNNFNVMGAISYTELGDIELRGVDFFDGTVWNAEFRVSYNF